MSQRKFLIVSNVRTGSTWLETMLGTLPDVHADYELKWMPEYQPSPVHQVIQQTGGSCSHILERISPAVPVVGSKLVLDPQPFSGVQYARLARTIEPEIRIIHLTRSYPEVFLSCVRGCFNVLRDPERTAPTSELLRSLQRDNAAVARSVLKRKTLTLEHCVSLMLDLQMNDRFFETLNDGREFLSLRYPEIPVRFEEVTRFIGSTAPGEVMRTVLAAPPTKRLPVVSPGDVIENAEAVMAVIEYLERTDPFRDIASETVRGLLSEAELSDLRERIIKQCATLPSGNSREAGPLRPGVAGSANPSLPAGCS